MAIKLTAAQARKLRITPPGRKSRVATATVDFAMLCGKLGFPVPMPEYRFCPPREFAFDWCWPELRVALEKDGGIYGRGKACPVCKRRAVGAHTSIQRLKSDQEKSNIAAIMGYCVLHARPEQFESGEVFELVRQALRAAAIRNGPGDEER